MSWLGEIRLFAFTQVPAGFEACAGRELMINQNQALYSLLGLTFGGTPNVKFKLPDLRGRAVVGAQVQANTDAKTGVYRLGDMAGVETVTLVEGQLPAHTHLLQATDGDGNAPFGKDTNLASPRVSATQTHQPIPIYADAAGAASTLVSLASSTVSTEPGDSLPHNNIQPSAALNFCLVVSGYYPSSDGLPPPTAGKQEGEAVAEGVATEDGLTAEDGLKIEEVLMPEDAIEPVKSSEPEDVKVKQTTSDQYFGEVRLFAGERVPGDWHVCDGTLLSINEHQALYALLGTTWGGDGNKTFAIPDLRSRVPVGVGQGIGLTLRVLGGMFGEETAVAKLAKHTHAFQATTSAATTMTPNGAVLAKVAPVDPVDGLYIADAETNTVAKLDADAVEPAGGSGSHPNSMPAMALTYMIALMGLFPAPGKSAPRHKKRHHRLKQGQDDEALTGEVRAFPYFRLPPGWMACDGMLLPVGQYQALFAVIGNKFGGDGKTTFALPNLCNRIVVGTGEGPRLTNHERGDVWGTETVTLTIATMPRHTHRIVTQYTLDQSQLLDEPANTAVLSRTDSQFDFRKDAVVNTTLASLTLAAAGGGNGHENRQPVLGLRYCICVDGEYPMPAGKHPETQADEKNPSEDPASDKEIVAE